MIQATVGMVQVPTGQESRAAVPALPMADIASAMFAALGVVTALLARERGASGTIDVSMLVSLLSWEKFFVVPPVNGLPLSELPPLEPAYGVFATSDAGLITLSVAGGDHMWQALCDLLALPQCRQLSETEREARVREIDPVLRQALAERPTEAPYAELESRGNAFGPVVQGKQVLQSPQGRHRGMMAQGVGLRQQTFVKQLALCEGANFDITRPPPALGEHNAELLSTLTPGQAPA